MTRARQMPGCAIRGKGGCPDRRWIEGWRHHPRADTALYDERGCDHGLAKAGHGGKYPVSCASSASAWSRYRPWRMKLVIDFGVSGYLALDRFERVLDPVVTLAVRYQREEGYKQALSGRPV